MTHLDGLEQDVVFGAVLELVGLRHGITSAGSIQRTAAEIGRKWSQGELNRAAETVPDLAAAVLDAIGVHSTVGRRDQSPPPWAGESWERYWGGNQPVRPGTAEWEERKQALRGESGPELQRLMRTRSVVFSSAESGAVEMWLSGLADLDLETIGANGAALECAALRAVEVWAGFRLAARMENAAEKFSEWFAAWEARAVGMLGRPAEEQLAKWLRKDASPSGWLERVCAVALLVAEVETKRAPSAVMYPVVAELLATPARTSPMFLDNQARLGSLVATVHEEAVCAMGVNVTLAGNKLLARIQTPRMRRLLRDVSVRSQMQSFYDSAQTTVGYPGGLAGFEERFGGKREQWKDDLNAAVHLQLSVRSADGTTSFVGSGLFTWGEHEFTTKTGRQKEILITPGVLLARGGAQKLFPSSTGLVPLLKFDPPIPASLPSRLEAGAWRVSDSILLHFVRNWRGALGAERDVYRIERRWLEDVATAGDFDDHERLWGSLVPAFIEGTESTPSLIQVVSEGRTWMEIRLADVHTAEREFIANGVKKRLNGAVGGQTKKRRK